VKGGLLLEGRPEEWENVAAGRRGQRAWDGVPSLAGAGAGVGADKG